MRDSFIFYKSFFDSIRELEPLEQVKLYDAIFRYQFEGEKVELTGVCKSLFILILPLLEANNIKYENGKKGGRPKTESKPKDNLNETKEKPSSNLTETQCIMYNDKCIMNNDNTITTSSTSINIYDYIENNFGRTLSPIEYEEVSKWEDSDLTRYAISQAVLNGKYNLKYISRIIDNYKKSGIISVQQAKQSENDFKKGKEIKPSWIDKKFECEEPDEEERKQLEEELKKYS